MTTARVVLALTTAIFWPLDRVEVDAASLRSPLSARLETRTAVLAGGCFWGIEGVYEHIKGVINVVSGYTGGSDKNPTYEAVSSGRTGHAESVRITYDPVQVSFETLLEVFFHVAHDPTQLNRQGPDVGTQYRSAIFYANDEQARGAREYIERLSKQRAFRDPIVTQVVALEAFYLAEEYHQDYMEHHPNQPYIVYNDRPKVEHLRKQYPKLFKERNAGT
ncbi:MAG: peptide-methionine (S)-S-oxide reductase MsrA [Longimicrobiales bacterium]